MLLHGGSHEGGSSAVLLFRPVDHLSSSSSAQIRETVSCSVFVDLQVLVPFAEDGSVAVERNEDLPEYLPEDESPSQEPDKAVSRVGSSQDSASWLGAAANFLSRSFYW